MAAGVTLQPRKLNSLLSCLKPFTDPSAHSNDIPTVFCMGTASRPLVDLVRADGMRNWFPTSAANRVMFFLGFIEVAAEHPKPTGQAFLGPANPSGPTDMYLCHVSCVYLCCFFSEVFPKVFPYPPKLPSVGIVLLGYSTYLLSLPVHSISTILTWSGLLIAHLTQHRLFKVPDLRMSHSNPSHTAWSERTAQSLLSPSFLKPFSDSHGL